MLELRNGSCFPKALIAVNVAIALINGAIAAVAFFQLIRIHSRSLQLGWTRQKVFHILIGSASIGYFIYFVFNLIATCKRWLCWSQSCGFVSMAFPKILFLAAFLLLLSFWADLCHQADDEDEDEECNREALLENTSKRPNLLNTDGFRKCLPLRCIRIGNRQRFVILVILSIFVLMVASAVLMWIETVKNPVDTSFVARVYLDLFAAAVLLSGGAIACYGFLLFFRMRRVRSDRASSEMCKVASLAVVSVICFTSSAFVALFTDIPLLYYWHQQQVDEAFTSALLIIYYCIGSSVPSVFLLWIMRELPPSVPANIQEARTITFMPDSSIAVHPSRPWTTVTSAQNQISRASPI